MKKKFGIKHYFNYFLINQLIAIKIKIEYMSHFYVDLIYIIFSSLISILLANIFSSNFYDIIKWTFIDFMIFLTLRPFAINLGVFFMQNKTLANKYIKTGKFNVILLKPGSYFLNYILIYTEASQFFYFVIRLLIFAPFVFINGNYNIIDITSAISFCIFLAIFLSIFLSFIDSFSWIYLESGKHFVQLYEFLDNFFKTFPGVFFKEFRYSGIALVIPIYLVAVVAVPMFKGVYVNLFEYILTMILLIIIMIIWTYYNWKHGIKKYNAYG